MLTQNERVRSALHKYLTKLDRFYRISEYNDKLPDAVKTHDLLGIYIDNTGKALCIDIDGVYDLSANLYIKFEDIENVSTNEKDVGKLFVDTIILYLYSGKVVELVIDGFYEKSYLGSEKRFSDIWQIFTFLRRVKPIINN